MPLLKHETRHALDCILFTFFSCDRWCLGAAYVLAKCPFAISASFLFGRKSSDVGRVLFALIFPVKLVESTEWATAHRTLP